MKSPTDKEEKTALIPILLQKAASEIAETFSTFPKVNTFCPSTSWITAVSPASITTFVF
ncbi:hypothetical protein [Bartonella sp. MM73XJBT.G]|uniref:hypothetical protein n=1 Tax=Bartonella sp. MM73XJBT.G TaxID=3019097 RepID=UPI002360E9BE|nr:hypothetical protein [Bartonella sp. MM73XJBT.G]